MNVEKELLLALLIEKYTQAKITKTTENIVKIKQPRKRRARTKAHRWTNEQKAFLLQQRAKGHEMHKIAAAMGLRTKQVENMHYSLTSRKEKAVN